jgi:cytochrome c peroxidase
MKFIHLISAGILIMFHSTRRFSAPAVGILLLLAAAAGFWGREWMRSLHSEPPPATRTNPSLRPEAKDTQMSTRLAPESSAAYDPDWKRSYPQYQALGKDLQPCPDLKAGEICPQDLSVYGGRGRTSLASIEDVVTFEAFYKMCAENKVKVNAQRANYIARRYNFTGKVEAHATMTRGKPLPVGPVVRLPEGVASWSELAARGPEELRKRDLFPLGFRPLSHPLHTNGHQLFPQRWLKNHPEHERFDVDFDIPDAYLPEFPPPLFLINRPDLGDVSQGREITQANFHELLDGILTPEQMEGLRLLVTKFPTSWFNQTKHRLTREPIRGVACFDCHVNGHTNGAIALDPATRPTLLRTRVDTPTLRGNHNNLVFSSRRSIRSTNHFAEVEEYFDGDIALQPQIGGRQLDRVSTNRMGDFNSIIGWPPAPKLDRFGKLIPSKATAAELRGEALFHGKARCNVCHPPPFYLDDKLHDLRVEEFYPGRAEGWIKTFSLRGIKDSPPYLHDGRLPTLEDAVEFFNLILQLKLNQEEKPDLVAFLRTL